MADMLLGRINPAGRLPITFYNSERDLPPLADYEIEKGRTYMYLKKPADFVFGHGLSYTTFAYEGLKIERTGTGGSGPVATQPAAAAVEPMLKINVNITNSGGMDGDEVVQLYVSKAESAVTRPMRQLKDFTRVPIAKGAAKAVQLQVPLRELAYWDVQTKRFVVEPGKYVVEVGASSADIRLKGEVEVK
jgi:beta-glucosidase